jgi:hypothetical protein
VRRKDREERLFEGKKIATDLTLLEIGGHGCENGRHSLRDKGKSAKQPHSLSDRRGT